MTMRMTLRVLSITGACVGIGGGMRQKANVGALLHMHEQACETCRSVKAGLAQAPNVGE